MASWLPAGSGPRLPSECPTQHGECRIARPRQSPHSWSHAAARTSDVASALREMAAAGRPAKAVLLTHNETSTGVENPIEALAVAVRHETPDALILVDAISGLGAVPFDTDGWDLDVVATGSQ